MKKALGNFIHFSGMLMVVSLMSMFINSKIMLTAAVIVAVITQVESDDGFDPGTFFADIIGALAGFIFAITLGL